MIRKIFLFYVVLFMGIVPMVEAYEEIHEPDIVYINDIGMYKSVAETIMESMGKECFYKKEKNKKYLLLDSSNCTAPNNLFDTVLELYKNVLKKEDLQHGKSAGNMVLEERYVEIVTKNVKMMTYLSVKVNKAKKIIVELGGIK